jgi:hypothetical protein
VKTEGARGSSVAFGYDVVNRGWEVGRVDNRPSDNASGTQPRSGLRGTASPSKVCGVSFLGAPNLNHHQRRSPGQPSQQSRIPTWLNRTPSPTIDGRTSTNPTSTDRTSGDRTSGDPLSLSKRNSGKLQPTSHKNDRNGCPIADPGDRYRVVRLRSETLPPIVLREHQVNPGS